MMVTVAELEAVIAQTPSGEQVQFDTKLIGSVDHVTNETDKGRSWGIL
jgi:hypothetical protein